MNVYDRRRNKCKFNISYTGGELPEEDKVINYSDQTITFIQN